MVQLPVKISIMRRRINDIKDKMKKGLKNIKTKVKEIDLKIHQKRKMIFFKIYIWDGYLLKERTAK